MSSGKTHLAETQTLLAEHHAGSKNFTVIGVMPAGYAFPLDDVVPKLWRTFATEAEVSDPKLKPVTSVRGAHFLSVVGRLKGGSVWSGHAKK